MTDNHIYNLAKQLVQENKSLWRIKNNYLKDSENCEVCQNFWKKLHDTKENHTKELEDIIKNHLK